MLTPQLFEPLNDLGISPHLPRLFFHAPQLHGINVPLPRRLHQSLLQLGGCWRILVASHEVADGADHEENRRAHSNVDQQIHIALQSESPFALLRGLRLTPDTRRIASCWRHRGNPRQTRPRLASVTLHRSLPTH